MKIETIIAAAIGGAAGIFGTILAFIKFITERKDKKKTENLGAILDKHLAPIQAELKEAKEEIKLLKVENHEIMLETTRIQLLMLIQHQPKNHDTILKVAERYFCQLHGDWYMSVELQSWADTQKINIPKSIAMAIEKNDK